MTLHDRSPFQHRFRSGALALAACTQLLGCGAYDANTDPNPEDWVSPEDSILPEEELDSVQQAAVYCEPGWVRTGDFIGQWISPWFTTTALQGKTRKVQFKALGGISGRYQYSNCTYGPVRLFPTASQYRVQLTVPNGLQTTSWTYYPDNTPARGWRSPGLCVGWDNVWYGGRWLTWSCL